MDNCTFVLINGNNNQTLEIMTKQKTYEEKPSDTNIDFLDFHLKNIGDFVRANKEGSTEKEVEDALALLYNLIRNRKSQLENNWLGNGSEVEKKINLSYNVQRIYKLELIELITKL